jgi:hypothetical protein
MQLDPGALRFATAVVMQGTMSEAFGGKFVNGAMSAAFTEAFNHFGEVTQKSLDAVEEFVIDIWEGISWRYEAVSTGLSKDFETGFFSAESWVNFTGGRSNNSFRDDFVQNYKATSIAFGPFEVDKTMTGFVVGGAMAKNTGGKTIAQWAFSGFRPATHLSSRAATARLVTYTTITNAARVGVAYETGNALGAGIRTGINRLATYLSGE